MLHAKIAADPTTVTTLPVLSALNCGASRKSTRAMTPAKHNSATSPVDIRPSGIAHTTDLISEQYSEHPTRKGYAIATSCVKMDNPEKRHQCAVLTETSVLHTWRNQMAGEEMRSVPLRSYAQDAEAALVVVERDSLDQAGDFLGRGPAHRGRCIHLWEFIFPGTVFLCVTRQEGDSTAIWLPGRVQVGSGRFRGAGSLLYQAGGKLSTTTEITPAANLSAICGRRACPMTILLKTYSWICPFQWFNGRAGCCTLLGPRV